MGIDARLLLPRHKSDLQNALAISALGYPATAAVLTELMMWLQDCNWPVASIIAPFLASIGTPMVDEVRRVLRTDDDIWKYWVLTQVVAEASPELANLLHDDLLRIAEKPTAGEQQEEVDRVAEEILRSLGPNAS